MLTLMLTLTAGIAACGGPAASAESPLTPAEFVEVVVEIREAEREVAGEDSASQLFKERRQEVLDRHATTEAELREFLDANARNLTLLEQVWDTINARLATTPPTYDEESEETVGPERRGGELDEELRDDFGDEGVESDPPPPARRVVPLDEDGGRVR